jgi:hypothetical protein
MFIRIFALALLLSVGSTPSFAKPEQTNPGWQKLTADEIRALQSNKTQSEYSGAGRYLRSIYYRSDGRAFVVQPPRNKGDKEWAGTGQWEIKNGQLCQPDFPLPRPCAPMYQDAPNNRIMRDYGFNAATIIRDVVDGDPKHLVAQVEKFIADTPTRAKAQAEERRGTVPAGTYLTGEEIRSLLTGKTTRELPTQRVGGIREPTLIYLQPDGIGYMSSDKGQTVWRGEWTIDGNRLCLSGAYWPCADFRRLADGKIMKEYGGPKGSRTVEVLEGDPDKVVEIVTSQPPYNQPATAQRPNQPKATGPSVLRNTTVQ